jgi:hypothetical protein
MTDALEQRLRAYGSTLDSATAEDLAQRPPHTRGNSARWPVARSRRVVAVLAILAVAAVATVAVVNIGGHPRTGTNIGVSSSTSPPTTSNCYSAKANEVTCSRGVLTLTPQQRGQCTPTCAEEGPTLTSEQAAQFARWRREYDPAEVKYITKGNPAADNVSVVETMVYRVACRETYAALHAAEKAAPGQRGTVVDNIMQPALAVIEERNWPPESATPRIFQRFADLLRRGAFATVSAQVKVGPGYGDCQDALDKRW